MTHQRMRLPAIVAVLLAALSVGVAHASLQFDFDALPGSDISFTGTSFVFTDEISGNYNDIVISGSTGWGDAIGLTGDIDGTFTVGAISSPAAGFEIAPVGGIGSLTINDGSFAATGVLQFSDISTIGSGIAGVVNLSGSVNLTGITYSGTNSDLQALADVGSAVATVSFSGFGDTLTNLTNGSNSVQNYSGVIAAIPEAASIFVWGALAMTAAITVRRREA